MSYKKNEQAKPIAKNWRGKQHQMPRLFRFDMVATSLALLAGCRTCKRFHGLACIRLQQTIQHTDCAGQIREAMADHVRPALARPAGTWSQHSLKHHSTTSQGHRMGRNMRILIGTKTPGPRGSEKPHVISS